MAWLLVFALGAATYAGLWMSGRLSRTALELLGQNVVAVAHGVADASASYVLDPHRYPGLGGGDEGDVRGGLLGDVLDEEGTWPRVDVLRRVSVFTVNVVYNMEPVYGILLAAIVFGQAEFMSGGFYLGASTIIARPEGRSQNELHAESTLSVPLQKSGTATTCSHRFVRVVWFRS